MREREIEVFADLRGEAIPVGRLFMRVLRGRQSASFSYHDAWLAHPERFSLDPNRLPLARGSFNTAGGEPIFGGLSDSAPDRWGRTLMARQHRLSGGRGTLFEADYLLMVHDFARQGALRFKEAGGGPFLADSPHPIPPLVRLGELLSASDEVQREGSAEEALKLLLAPGSSLGGARPKASVVDERGRLLVAKFPAVHDDWPVCVWEQVTCELAAAAGLDVQETRLEQVDRRQVLVARRFDREGDERLPFLSALALIGATDRDDEHSYLELADAIRQLGVRVAANLEELWRRMVFNVLVTNTDDHLRNHGFLWEAEGWVLSPAYDLNPVPLDVKPRVHALALDDRDARSSLRTVLAVADYFGLEPDRARDIARTVGKTTARWRDFARSRGLGRAEIERLASAFEHEDLEVALG